MRFKLSVAYENLSGSWYPDFGPKALELGFKLAETTYKDGSSDKYIVGSPFVQFHSLEDFENFAEKVLPSKIILNIKDKEIIIYNGWVE